MALVWNVLGNIIMHFTQVLAIPTADKCYVKHGWIAVLVDKRCMAHRYEGVQYNVM